MIKDVIVLDKIPVLIQQSRALADELETEYNRSIPMDEKYEKIFSTCVKFNLCDDIVLN